MITQEQVDHFNTDWYQPFDISLPHDGITEETQMHFGPAIFNIVKHKNILDTVEKLIGSEITSNPIQHVRIKPPEHAVPKDEIRAHIVSTDWHQDKYGQMLPHCLKTQVVIPDQFINTQDTIPVPVKAGGAVLFHPLTPHCSLSNTTDHYRWSFDLRYNVTGQPTGRSQFPEFIARSRSDPASPYADDVWER